jgi:hypothetical protein
LGVGVHQADSGGPEYAAVMLRAVLVYADGP